MISPFTTTPAGRQVQAGFRYVYRPAPHVAYRIVAIREHDVTIRNEKSGSEFPFALLALDLAIEDGTLDLLIG
jgi:hypothetical protein